MNKQIVIIGAGPAGLIFSLLSSTSNNSISLVESRQAFERKNDKRALALSASSRYILEKIDIWNNIEDKIIPIKSIHTSQKGTFGRSKLRADEFNTEALGYIIAYGDLIAALEEKVRIQNKIKLFYEAKVEKIDDITDDKQKIICHQANKLLTLDCNLLVLADGGHSRIDGLNIAKEEKVINHLAIVTQVHSDKPHKNIAFERFTSSGPIALLPNHKGAYSLVWTGPKDKINNLVALDKKIFLKALQEEFGERAGQFKSCEKRISFSLVQSSIVTIHNKNVVAIGNAAQIMHPVAGQGLNTGLRDALSLSDLIISNEAIQSSDELIKSYLESRRVETESMLKITEGLTTLFTNDFIGINRLRGLALAILDCTPILKKKFVQKMSYGK
ncbi:FAD-dependent monooxygenase [Methylophilaceae bacterium]|jgi:2-octaprenyl-6-methoxyphenol hydroxylase|nr:FAD-dependent monooxygenase [Methylophilaceae bacterium]